MKAKKSLCEARTLMDNGTMATVRHPQTQSAFLFIARFVAFGLFVAATYLLPSLALGDCFSGNGKAGEVKGLKQGWVFTVFLANRSEGTNFYRLKSFGTTLQGNFECKGENRTHCQGDHGPVQVKKTKNGMELHFTKELALNRRYEDNHESENGDEVASRNVASESSQIFKLDLAHSDICFDAFFRKAGASYDDFNQKEAVSAPSTEESTDQ